MTWQLIGLLAGAAVSIILAQAAVLRSMVTSRIDKLEAQFEKFAEKEEKREHRLTVLETEHENCKVCNE